VIVATHPRGVVAVTQADHARMCAELADAWGSPPFGQVPRSGEVRLAAEQHELGWAELDADPTLDPSTGFPTTLYALHFSRYIDGQVEGPRQLGERSAYAGLVAALHHSTLYRRPGRLASLRTDGRLIRSFFAASERLRAELGERAGVAPGDPEAVRAGRLVRSWDGLSHDLLLDRAPCSRHNVPLAAGELTTLRLERHGDAISVSPWPFAVPSLEAHARGRLLTRRASSREEMHEALGEAPVVTLSYALVPAGVEERAA
jgi:Protein of unknown function (DUF3891)